MKALVIFSMATGWSPMGLKADSNLNLVVIYLFLQNGHSCWKLGSNLSLGKCLMSMMLPCINLSYHAYNPLVYPIPFQFSFNNIARLQEKNDQAFPVTL